MAYKAEVVSNPLDCTKIPIFASMRQGIQKFGRALSGMIMPNIGAFIAWGLITALFIPSGWWPNENLAKLVSPTLKYLLPLLIAYTAGKNIDGDRGGVTGAIATIGIIIGSDIPMFLGAMIMGPLGGIAIKWFDRKTEGKIKAGFEMLVNNFSVGIIGMILAIISFLFIGGAVTWLTGILAAGTAVIIKHGLLPLVAIFVEPAKVLFLNNAINHGVFDPIGIAQASEAGKSIMFLIETNPGPGFGLLLACWAFGKGSTKESAPGAIVIQFLGGIHEIFFPYILAQPILVLATIAGSASALLFFSIMGCGLVAPASPGSIITVLAMAPKGETLLVLAGVLIATAVSFLVAAPLIKRRHGEIDVEAGKIATAEAKHLSDKAPKANENISKIMFACDAGMGSSALAASKFRSRAEKVGSKVKIANCAADSIPADTDIVVCQKIIAERIKDNADRYEIIAIDNFLADPALDILLQRITPTIPTTPAAEPAATAPAPKSNLLSKDNILVGLKPEPKEEAILRAGKMLEDGGYVQPGYADAMLARERLTTTYMGMGVAIPHGTSEAKDKVLHSGIVVLQYPEGVDFGDEKAKLIVGIAGVGDEHLDILSKLGETFENPEVLETLCTTDDADTIYQALN